MINDTIRIGTRGSQLALYQAYKVKETLETAYPTTPIEIVIIKTKGDKILDVALSKIGDKGLFTKELETELLEGRIDMAVHSLKDLPTTLPEGCALGGVLARGEYRDALVSLHGKTFDQLDHTDVVATSSLRRKAQLLRHHPQMKIVDIRGNVNTRLQKMQDGHCTAMIMAAAGLQRLKLDHLISEILDAKTFIPAVSQGAIAMEIRQGDMTILDLLTTITHQPTLQAVVAERAFLRSLEGGCQVPVGCFTQITDTQFRITGFASSLDASTFLEETQEGDLEQASNIALILAQKLKDRGASQILEDIRKLNNI